MSITVDEFKKAGWNLTEEGVAILKEWTELENPTFDDCLSVALNVSVVYSLRFLTEDTC
jgi:hypothetical protein